MQIESKSLVTEALAAVPSPNDIRRRIADNHQERAILRQLLKLAEKRETRNELNAEPVSD